MIEIEISLYHVDFEPDKFVKGKCQYDEATKEFGKVTIFKDSPYIENPHTRDATTPSVKETKRRFIEKRNDLVRNGIIANGIFLKDHVFNSLNEAGSIILGRNLSAVRTFKTVDENGRRIALNLFKVQGENCDVYNSANLDEFTPSSGTNVAENVIFYGVPGCGKSYYINERLGLNEKKENRVLDKYHKRILFHPEYSYSEFVGQTMPQTNSVGKIEYKFIPGPFVEILCDAYKNADKEYFLIIEEINRGNAPAIFGDLFQLLDRNADGESEYGIYNKDILNELEKIDSSIEEVKIPSNLTIFATMNTCDQNVFTLDTAFKRRWRLKRIPNDFNNDEFKSGLGKVEIINGITWQSFGIAINAAIRKYCSSGSSFEDKQLGTYFIKTSEAEDPEIFAEKVLMYLWDDVVKYDKSRLFDISRYSTLDEVINGFILGKNVFASHCEEIAALYPAKTEQTDVN